MHVLMLSWEYPPHVVGGLGKHVMDLVPALLRQGAEVHLITPILAGGDLREDLPGAGRVHRVPVPGPAAGVDMHGTCREANRLLEEYARQLWAETGGYSVIHAHDWLTAFAAGALKHAFKVPLLSTIHATERGRGRGHLASSAAQAVNQTEWWLTYESWRVVCCTRYMKNEITSYFGVPDDKIDVIPNGVDAHQFDWLDSQDLSQFRAAIALPHEPIVMSVGRMVGEKGMQVLLEAIPLVLHTSPAAKFVLAGTGPMLDDLRRRAWELGVGEKVLFTGFLPDEDRDRLYRIANMAVFPSLYEPFGIVALEAMAAGCPVVVSDAGGLKEVVSHSHTGITTYAGDPRSLAWGIQHTLDHPEWTHQRVEEALRVVRHDFSWDTIARQTLSAYDRLVDERSHVDW